MGCDGRLALQWPSSPASLGLHRTWLSAENHRESHGRFEQPETSRRPLLLYQDFDQDGTAWLRRSQLNESIHGYRSLTKCSELLLYVLGICRWWKIQVSIIVALGVCLDHDDGMASNFRSDRFDSVRAAANQKRWS